MTPKVTFCVLTMHFFGLVWAAGRTVIPLDGTWQIAQGTMEQPTEDFSRTCPVPGLADLARPAYDEVGVASKLRQAFWYRRTVQVPAPRRAVAFLKVTKAQFGTKVWVNGKDVGPHWGCFTPGYFDVTEALKWGEPNEIVIRVGAYRDAVPPWVPTNTDYEQSKWIPGIYDSVTLTLADEIYVASVQVAPDVVHGLAKTEVVVRNAGAAPKQVPLRLSIREWKSGKAAGAAVERRIAVPAGREAVVRVPVRLDRPHLWSPEDPFLYVLRAQAGEDAVETRFGMRELRFDPETGRAILNGQPYFLRGTNFCMFRFFEDPIRGDLPWNREWVQRLLELPKTALHWNSARVCIAPFPEFWYDLTDEIGWLLQDEFPIWGFHEEWSQEELEREFAEWVRERWNHPSIVVWDACNETLTPRTGQLIEKTRRLDLSGRPWDDGYSRRHRPTDPMEIHPYLFLGQAVEWDPGALGAVADRAVRLLDPPFIINEYDALWLQRDGTPATGYQAFFDMNLGPKATAEERRETLAYLGAALTEYWRARRDAAGVQWFCYLTYSRPGGVTSDNFIDLHNLVLEPHFLDYLSNAFAPLAVMIDDCRAWEPAGTEKRYNFIITNDLAAAKQGVVRVQLVSQEHRQTVSQEETRFRVEAFGQTSVSAAVKFPGEAGAYMLRAELRAASGEKAVSRRKIQVLTPQEAWRRYNLAEGKPVTASSEVTDARGNCPARFVNDGKPATRWSSEFSDPQWIQIDLGEEQTIGRVELTWEAAYGKSYRIEVSSDGQNWRTVYETDDGRGGTEKIAFEPTRARYVKLHGLQRGTQWGYSLWELKVFAP